jgi:hypothetical protein
MLSHLARLSLPVPLWGLASPFRPGGPGCAKPSVRAGSAKATPRVAGIGGSSRWSSDVRPPRRDHFEVVLRSLLGFSLVSSAVDRTRMLARHDCKFFGQVIYRYINIDRSTAALPPQHRLRPQAARRPRSSSTAPTPADLCRAPHPQHISGEPQAVVPAPFSARPGAGAATPIYRSCRDASPCTELCPFITLESGGDNRPSTFNLER